MSSAPRYLQLPTEASSRAPQGAKAKPLWFEFSRTIEPRDLAMILSGEAAARRRPLSVIRAAHHQVAKLVAQNYSDVEVSGITGRSPTSVKQLRFDPAFKHLVAHYRDMADAIEVDVLAQAKNLSSAALAELQQRIEENPERFSEEDLTKLAEKLMDRTGLGPSKTIKTIDAVGVVQALVAKKQAEAAGRVIEPEAAD